MRGTFFSLPLFENWGAAVVIFPTTSHPPRVIPRRKTRRFGREDEERLLFGGSPSRGGRRKRVCSNYANLCSLSFFSLLPNFLSVQLSLHTDGRERDSSGILLLLSSSFSFRLLFLQTLPSRFFVQLLLSLPPKKFWLFFAESDFPEDVYLLFLVGERETPKRTCRFCAIQRESNIYRREGGGREI